MQDGSQNGGQNFSSSIFGDVVLDFGDGEEGEEEEEKEDAWGIDIEDEDVQILAKFKSL